MARWLSRVTDRSQGSTSHEYFPPVPDGRDNCRRSIRPRRDRRTRGAGSVAATGAAACGVLPDHQDGALVESGAAAAGARPGGATYRYQGATQTFEDLLERSSARSLVVLHDGKIVDERYFDGYTADSHFNSWSVGKSITSPAVGIAIELGLIDSLDDPITRYLPELQGSGYDGIPIEHILQMSSGQDCGETDYTAETEGTTGTTIRMVLGEPLLAQTRQSARVVIVTNSEDLEAEAHEQESLVAFRAVADQIAERAEVPAGAGLP